MFDIYYAHIYMINNGSPILVQDLPLKSDSLDSAWSEAIKITFNGDIDKLENQKMLMVFKKIDPF